MCEAGKGEKLEIIMDDATAFNDLKEYLAEQGIASGRFMTERKCWYNSVSN